MQGRNLASALTATVCLETVMANTTLEVESFHGNHDSFESLGQLADRASELETVLRHARSTLDAIEHGDLLSDLPADPHAAGRHNCATNLLEMLSDAIKRVEDLPGTDLSVHLSFLARRTDEA